MEQNANDEKKQSFDDNESTCSCGNESLSTQRPGGSVFLENDDDGGKIKASSLSIPSSCSGKTIQTFDRLHKCLEIGDDPFEGLVGDEMKQDHCCPTRAYLLNENQRLLTMFGKRFQQVVEIRETDDFGFRRFLLAQNVWVKVPIKVMIRSIKFTDIDNVKWLFTECSVCTNYRYVRQPPCCQASICYQCWHSYVEMQSKSLAIALTGTYNLVCFGCQKLVPYPQTLTSLEDKTLALIKPPAKTSLQSTRCPNCLKEPPVGKEMSLKTEAKMKKQKGGNPIECSQCSVKFCSLCGVLDHPEKSCKELMSDKTMKEWAEQKNNHSIFQVGFCSLSFQLYSFLILLLKLRMLVGVPSVASGSPMEVAVHI